MRHCDTCARAISETESSYRFIDGTRACVSCVNVSTPEMPESEYRKQVLGIGLNSAQRALWEVAHS